MLTMPLDSPGKSRTFGVATNLHQFVDIEIVIYLFYCLFNYGPFVQVGGHIMRSRTNHLHTPHICLAIRVGTFEAR